MIWPKDDQPRRKEKEREEKKRIRKEKKRKEKKRKEKKRKEKKRKEENTPFGVNAPRSFLSVASAALHPIAKRLLEILAV